MFGIEPLTPAYGRDFKDVAQFKRVLLSGADVTTANGEYCSIRDLRRMGITSIQVRFGKGPMGYEKTGIINLEQT